MYVAIPSKGRAGKSKSLQFFGVLATAVVPSVEVKSYEQNHVGPVVGVPISVVGITATRNWILAKAREEGHRWVVMVDDDVKAQGWIELGDENGHHRELSPEQWVIEWRRLFEVAESLKYRLWGVATDGALRSVYPFKPFLWRTYVTGSMMGIINDGQMVFDESYRVKEDYELCLRCLLEDGGIVGARYLYWATEHWSGEGGCKDYRTATLERTAVEKLMRSYPGLIRRVTRGGSEWSIDLTF